MNISTYSRADPLPCHLYRNCNWPAFILRPVITNQAASVDREGIPWQMISSLLDPAPHRGEKLTGKHVGVETFRGQDILTVETDGLAVAWPKPPLATSTICSGPAHLKQLAAILDDPEATENDRFVALDLLKNANIAAGGVLPMCQDTGTAIIMAQEGPQGLDRRQAITRP